MPQIIAYTYEAGMHCIRCTRKRFGWQGVVAANMQRARLRDGRPRADENGISTTAYDNEGNEVHPVFRWDENDPEGQTCDDCFATIKRFNASSSRAMPA